MKLRLLGLLFLTVALLCGLTGGDDLLNPVDDREPEIRSVESVTTDVAAMVGTFASGPLDRPSLLESMKEFDTYYGGVDPRHEASYHVRAFFDNGGQRIWISRAASSTGSGLMGDRTAETGLFALEYANRFDLLLVPEIFTSADIADRAFAASEAIRYAASRGAMFLLDPAAESTSTEDAVSRVSQSGTGLRDRHGVLYFGRIAVGEDSDSGARRWIGASGAAAGVYARNDRERGVWKTPAGPRLPLAGVLDVDPLTDAEVSQLTAAEINPVVASDGDALLWGGRTLSTDLEFTYIAVQRLTLYVEARVRDTLAWTRGETSNVALWEDARSDVEAILAELWREGAFQGERAQDGYFVRSDGTTHTAEDMAAGRLNVVIGYAPTRAAEFIVRRITINL